MGIFLNPQLSAALVTPGAAVLINNWLELAPVHPLLALVAFVAMLLGIAGFVFRYFARWGTGS